MTKDKTDEKFLERIKEIAPEVLEADVNFDEKIIRALPSKRTKDKPLVSTRKPRRAKSKQKSK